MSKRDGLSVSETIGLVALAIIVLLLLFATSYFLIERHEERERSYQSSYSKYQETKRKQAPGAAADSEPSIRNPESYRAEWRDEQDLKAQREMAEWAYYLLWISLWGLGVTIVGLFFVIKTFHEQKRATDVAAKTAVRQLRGYVGAKAARIEMDEEGKIKFCVRYMNYGATPALDVVAKTSCTAMRLPFNISSLNHPLATSMSNGVYWPNQIFQAEGFLRKSPDSPPAKLLPQYRADIEAGRSAIFLHGVIRYSDVFGKRRKTKFRFMYTGPWGGKQSLRICEEGNKVK